MNFVILFIIIEYIVITFVFGLVYKLVGTKNSMHIKHNFGWSGYCVLGSIGVTFHELSHLITSVLFGHKINEVRLFRPFKGSVDGTLGYVNHSWNNNSMYQKIGNFFIGTAPMFFGAGLLFIVLRIAYPSAFTDVTEISEIPNSLMFAFSNMFNLSNLFTTWTLIVSLIAIFICPYMHMSWSDIKGAASGAVALIITAFIISLASEIIPDDVVSQTQVTMNTFVTYYIYSLILGLIVSIVMMICLCLLSIIRGR